jgi:hypothetical protein
MGAPGWGGPLGARGVSRIVPPFFDNSKLLELLPTNHNISPFHMCPLQSNILDDIISISFDEGGRRKEGGCDGFDNFHDFFGPDRPYRHEFANTVSYYSLIPSILH